jgi:hypothetical protein
MVVGDGGGGGARGGGECEGRLRGGGGGRRALAGRRGCGASQAGLHAALNLYCVLSITGSTPSAARRSNKVRSRVRALPSPPSLSCPWDAGELDRVGGSCRGSPTASSLRAQNRPMGTIDVGSVIWLASSRRMMGKALGKRRVEWGGHRDGGWREKRGGVGMESKGRRGKRRPPFPGPLPLPFLPPPSHTHTDNGMDKGHSPAAIPFQCHAPALKDAKACGSARDANHPPCD